MNFIYEKITHIFDPLQHLWEHEKMHRKIAAGLVVFFLFSFVAIECKRQGLLPDILAQALPANHFHSVQLSFTVVLILEVISLIFTLPCSFSRSVGKQFEILALILLRNAFKELAMIPEPVTFTGSETAVLHIVSDGFGALLIFALLNCYYYLLTKSSSSDEKMIAKDLFIFVATKKGIALLLLISFILMGGRSVYLTVTGVDHSDFLYDFYTLLILTDVLVVLISQCFHPSFLSVFRNSGYALSTLLIRLALAAPPLYNILLGLAASLFSILLIIISNRPTIFKELFRQRKGTEH